MLNPFAALKKYGLSKTVNLAFEELGYRYSLFKVRNVDEYPEPTAENLALIEMSLAERGIQLSHLQVDPSDFRSFLDTFPFPPDYHGGLASGHWHEKLFEHYISYKILGLNHYSEDDVYVDVAACGSPWASMLRNQGVKAYAIDLNIQAPYDKIPYYLTQDATATSFSPSSIKGISLHCAYEMFNGSDDIKALTEFGRILAPGGSVIIAPLYLHTHYCCYSSAEYWGKGYSDSNAKSYVRRGCRQIPSSRKYDAQTLKKRVLDTAVAAGLEPLLYCLRNQKELSPEIYCHFVLQLRKNHDSCQ